MKRTCIMRSALAATIIGTLLLAACGTGGTGTTTVTTSPAATTTASTAVTSMPSTAPTTALSTGPSTMPTTVQSSGTSSTISTTTVPSITPVVTPATTVPAGKLTFRYDFNKGDNGWTAGYSDYSKGMETGIEFGSGIAPLPDELKQLGQAYRVSSKNISDDVFMYLKRKLGKADGIVPMRTYKATIEVSFATNAFAGSVGIGGSPAESVYVKVGGAPQEPKTVPSTNQGPDYLALSIDKGSQSQGGRYAVQIGNVAKTDGSTDNRYALKTLSNASQAVTITSDANGELWILVGTDSGFEGTTTLFYTTISVTLAE